MHWSVAQGGAGRPWAVQAGGSRVARGGRAAGGWGGPRGGRTAARPRPGGALRRCGCTAWRSRAGRGRGGAGGADGGWGQHPARPLPSRTAGKLRDRGRGEEGKGAWALPGLCLAWAGLLGVRGWGSGWGASGPATGPKSLGNRSPHPRLAGPSPTARRITPGLATENLFANVQR